FSPASPLRAGTYASVEIVRAAPHFLQGELREVLAEPSHRIRIPVASA
ncbi:MAG: hypothetical protein RL487_351, partial [Actinomycetota bacterium]